MSSALFVRGKSSAFSSPGITATKIWFFEKPRTKPVLVYENRGLYNLNSFALIFTTTFFTNAGDSPTETPGMWASCVKKAINNPGIK